MKAIVTMGLVLFAAFGCTPTPAVSPVAFDSARAETDQKDGLRISTDRTAQKIKVQSPDLELILPYAADWIVGSRTLDNSTRIVLMFRSIERNMV
jgi:hypothetical protein